MPNRKFAYEIPISYFGHGSISRDSKMVKIQSFHLRNFKGATNVDLDLSKRFDKFAITLIGLNESGKTNILEGISHFSTSDKVILSLFQGPVSNNYIHSLIPINQKAAFSDDIDIIAKVELDESDFQDISKIFSDNKLQLDKDTFQNIITITTKYKFINSEYIESEHNHYWFMEFNVRKRKNQKFKLYIQPSEKSKGVDLWLGAVNLIEHRLPKIVYFPTFLVEMPSKIFLKPYNGETIKNKHYRVLLQDILNSIGGDLSLKTHVVDRIEKFKSENKAYPVVPGFADMKLVPAA